MIGLVFIRLVFISKCGGRGFVIAKVYAMVSILRGVMVTVSSKRVGI